MANIFKLPDLGEGIHEAEIVSVQVKVGDSVKEGDIVLEVETDKAIVEIPSPYSDTIATIYVKPGDRLNVGDDLIAFGKGASDQSEESKGAESKAAESNAPGEKDRESKSAGKASGTDGEIEAAQTDQGEARTGTKIIPASPATRRLALELGVDLQKVKPTGPEGLVTAGDVKAHAEKAKGAGTASDSDAESREAPAGQDKKEASEAAVTAGMADRGEAPRTPALPDFSKWGPVRREKMNAVRRAIARQMTLSWSQVPHVNSQDFADITELEKLRKQYQARIEQKGAKLTLTVFVLKAIATALKTYPRFNASLDPETDEVIFKEYYHIGLAVDTPDGLIVPVIRDVDRKSIVEIAVELTDLVQRTRNRKAKLAEMQGSSFTITNAGSMGGGYFAPIINFPEVAIMGLGQAAWQPVARKNDAGEQEMVIRFMLPLILSIDHRALDGADAIRFLLMVKSALEDPQELMMTMI